MPCEQVPEKLLVPEGLIVAPGQAGVDQKINGSRTQ
jgi:hypothetical protein